MTNTGGANRAGHKKKDESGWHLHEAAPDLLAACEALVKKLEMWEGSVNPESFECMKAGRNAIAKAKGDL